MALGFGKKNNEEAGQADGAFPAGDESLFDSDTLAFDNNEELSLEQFAAELQASPPPSVTGGSPAPAQEGLSWDEDSLLGDLGTDPFAPASSAPPPAPVPAATSAAESSETTLFDDLAAELEGIPGLTADHVAATAAAAGAASAAGAAGAALTPPAEEPATGGRRRRRGSSPDITAPGALTKPEKGAKTPKAPREKGAGGNKKLPLMIVGGLLLVATIGGGGYVASTLGGAAESFDESQESIVATDQPDEGAAPAAEPTPAEAGEAAPAAAPLKPAELKAKLRQLWTEGAAAKHRGDKEGARRLWQEALKLDPTNKGFQESLAKLNTPPKP